MTDDQITALAREYAEFTDLSPADKKNVSAICENFLKYTLRRYCLVDKKDIETKYQEAKERYLNPDDEIEKTMYGGRMSLLEYLCHEIGKGDTSNVASNVASSKPYVDGLRNHNRLHIATQITASIYSNDKDASRFNSIEALVRKALDIADTLIAECELSPQASYSSQKGGTDDKYFDSPSLFPNEP